MPSYSIGLFSIVKALCTRGYTLWRICLKEDSNGGVCNLFFVFLTHLAILIHNKWDTDILSSPPLPQSGFSYRLTDWLTEIVSEKVTTREAIASKNALLIRFFLWLSLTKYLNPAKPSHSNLRIVILSQWFRNKLAEVCNAIICIVVLKKLKVLELTPLLIFV